MYLVRSSQQSHTGQADHQEPTVDKRERVKGGKHPDWEIVATQNAAADWIGFTQDSWN